ncbi:MAG: class I SAM-dependent methyltransferase [Myxococcota bacterium]
MTAPKSFDDVQQYEQEIRRLVPGYDLLHTMLPAVLRATAPECKRVLAIGCGPAREVVTLAHELEGSIIDALDPSPAMVATARKTVEDAGLTERIRIIPHALADFTVERPYDAVVALLVGHLVADDGSRARFLEDLSKALCPGAVAVLAELEDAGPAHALLTEAHLHCSEAAGVDPDRIITMRQRLSGRFHAITRARLAELASGVGLRVNAEFFRSFGFVGLLLERAGNRSPQGHPAGSSPSAS